MKQLFENWRRYLTEEQAGRLWVVAGPPGVGKTYSVENPVKALGLPGLIVQDMDHIPAVKSATESYMSALGSLPPEEQYSDSPSVRRATAAASPKANAGISGFISQHAGKDILLVGIAWLSPELPFDFPENAQKMYLFKDPETIIRQKMDRDHPGKEVSEEDMQSAIADLEKENRLYDERGWKRMSADDIVALVKSSYEEEPDETTF